jgi:hypothetical protein
LIAAEGFWAIFFFFSSIMALRASVRRLAALNVALPAPQHFVTSDGAVLLNRNPVAGELATTQPKRLGFATDRRLNSSFYNRWTVKKRRRRTKKKEEEEERGRRRKRRKEQEKGLSAKC